MHMLWLCWGGLAVCNQRCMAAAVIKAIFHWHWNKRCGSPRQVIQFLFVGKYFIPLKPRQLRRGRQVPGSACDWRAALGDLSYPSDNGNTDETFFIPLPSSASAVGRDHCWAGRREMKAMLTGVAVCAGGEHGHHHSWAFRGTVCPCGASSFRGVNWGGTWETESSALWLCSSEIRGTTSNM